MRQYFWPILCVMILSLLSGILIGVVFSPLGTAASEMCAPHASIENPRSYLKLNNETDLRNWSGLSSSDIDSALQGSPLAGYGRHFVEAERHFGVNAEFLVALAWLESGGGTSRIFAQKNNAFGFGAYDHAPFDSAYTFSSVEEGIFAVSKYISSEYLSIEGKWYGGGTTIFDVAKYYSTDPLWAQKVLDVAKMLF